MPDKSMERTRKPSKNAKLAAQIVIELICHRCPKGSTEEGDYCESREKACYGFTWHTKTVKTILDKGI